MTKAEVRRRAVEMSRRVPVRIEAAVEILKHEPECLVGSVLTTGLTAAEVQQKLGVELPMGMHIARTIRVGLAPAFEDDGAFVVPMWWEAAEHPHLFPTFDGGLEASALDGATQLRLVGSYAPPLGAVGRLADGVVGHRIVTASLDALLTAAAERLEEAVINLR